MNKMFCIIDYLTPGRSSFSVALDGFADDMPDLGGSQTDAGDAAIMTEVPQSAARARSKRELSAATPAETNNNNSAASISNHVTAATLLKAERLSPASNHVDNASSSSRSATPSSSYPGTPPAQSPGSSPSVGNRNYSDMMRNLAAKYNNGNPNDYFGGTTRNGSTFPVTLDPRFAPYKSTPAAPFAGLLAPLATTTAAAAAPAASTPATKSSAAPKDTDALHRKSLDAQALYAAAANSFSSHFSNAAMFPPLIDMSSSQALLNIVRTATAHNASQLETYLKGATKRPAPNENSPLDLSAAAPPSRKPRKSFSEGGFFGGDAFLNMPMVESLRAKRKRAGSVSPLSRATPANGAVRLAAATVATPAVGGVNKCVSLCKDAAASVGHWTVDDVCSYVASIDACAEYAQNFRNERIDGSSLPLLSEEHLTTTMAMKLGPALKLKATLARRIGNCAVCSHCMHCHSSPSSGEASSSALAVAAASVPSGGQRPSSAD